MLGSSYKCTHAGLPLWLAFVLLLVLTMGRPLHAQPANLTLVPQSDSMLQLAQALPPGNDSLKCEYYWASFVERLVVSSNGQAFLHWADDYVATAKRSEMPRHMAGAWLVKAMTVQKEANKEDQFAQYMAKARGILMKDSLNRTHYSQLAGLKVIELYHAVLSEDFTQALKASVKGIEYAQHRPDWGMLSLLYRELGQTYGRTGNLASVREYYGKSLNAARRANRPLLEGTTLINIAEIYRLNKQADSALLVLEQARYLLEKNKGERLLAIVYLSMGQIYEGLGSFNQVFAPAQKGLAILEKLPYMSGVKANGYMLLASAYLNTRRLGEAQQAVNQAAVYLTKIKNLDLEAQLASLRARIAEKQGNYKGALQYERLQSRLQDSLDAPNLARQRDELMQQFEARQREMEIANLRRRNEEEQLIVQRQKIYIVSASGAALLFLLLLFWVYRINQQLASARRQLEDNHNTIRKQLERLQQVSQTKDKLFNIIAHDLRGPVTGFQLLPDMIEMAAVTGETPMIIELANDLKQSSTSLSNLLDRLLTWAQSQNDTLTFAPETLFIYTVLGRQRDLYVEPAKAKNIEILVEAEEGLQIYADRNSIETALRNLLNNAVKFSQLDGKIWLKGYKQDDRAIIEVRDSGMGIPPDVLAKLFVPGAAGSTTGTAGEKGVGLGMVLIKELVDHNNGSITVDSQLGSGTTFRVSLPMGKEVYSDPNAQQPNSAIIMNG